MVDEILKKRFANTYKFSNHDINKFILLVWKGVNTYECMDDCEKFDEISLPKKEEFCYHWNMEDIINADYAYAKIGCQDFETKKLGEYHNLYVQSDILLLPGVFANFRNMCHEICELDCNHLLSVQGGAWQAAFRSSKK